jgi:proteasome assembly chaperone (PAC2) family protein
VLAHLRYREVMDAIRWTGRPELRDPVMVCAFKGWNDAGEAATAAVSLLVSSLEADQVAEIDPEEYFDYTAVRPTIRLSEGLSKVIEWPAPTVHAARVAGAERDLVMVQGTEPSFRWRAFCDEVVGVARQLDVQMVVTLGALLADIPHTRPTAVTGLASDDTLVKRVGLERSSYEGPTGIVGVLHDAFARASLPSVSLWASVPHYIAAAPNPKAALELVRRVEGLVGVAVDAAELEQASEEYERQVSAAVASDPEVRAFVEQLEETIDESEEPQPHRIPSGDTIARDFQSFLRQRGQGEDSTD